MNKKTIRDAVKKMPKGSREIFIKLWETAGSMDLYEGILPDYICIIKQNIEGKDAEIANLKQKLFMIRQMT